MATVKTPVRKAARSGRGTQIKGSGRGGTEPPSTATGSGQAASRPLWKGVISFGMVTIPVRLFSATTNKDVSFNLLHEPCKSRLKFLRWCPVCEREAEKDEIVRGFEYGKGSYVTFSDAELDNLPMASKHTIELTTFVRTEEIDPIFFEKSYYLTPDEVAIKSFALLFRTLEEKGHVAVAKVGLRDKERLCILRPMGQSLVLETLYYQDEVRAAPVSELESVKVSDKELEMAAALVDLLKEPFDASYYRDEYREALMAAVDAKVQGRDLVEAPQANDDAIIDLTEALRATFEDAKRRKETERLEAAA